MASHRSTAGARPGDRIEVRGIPGAPARQGKILEIFGRPGHEHFRVSWDEARESLLYPTNGAVIVHGRARGRTQR